MLLEFQTCFKLQQNLSTTIKKMTQISIYIKNGSNKYIYYKVQSSFASTKFYLIVFTWMQELNILTKKNLNYIWFILVCYKYLKLNHVALHGYICYISFQKSTLQTWCHLKELNGNKHRNFYSLIVKKYLHICPLLSSKEIVKNCK